MDKVVLNKQMLKKKKEKKKKEGSFQARQRLKAQVTTYQPGGCQFKGATSQVAGSPAVLDRTLVVFDRTVIVLNPTVMTINGGHSFPPAWWRVRPSLVTPRC